MSSAPSPIYRGMINGGTWLVRRAFPKDPGRLGHCRCCGEEVRYRAGHQGDPSQLTCTHLAHCAIKAAAEPGEAGTDVAR